MWQVMAVGTPEQQAAAKDAIIDLRKTLYGILADGGRQPTPTGPAMTRGWHSGWQPGQPPPQVQLWWWGPGAGAGPQRPRPPTSPPSTPTTPVRIGDAERDTAMSDLGDHFAAGRLSREEFDERADQAMQARFSTDLDPLFADLPKPAAGGHTQSGRPRPAGGPPPWAYAMWLLPLRADRRGGRRDLLPRAVRALGADLGGGDPQDHRRDRRRSSATSSSVGQGHAERGHRQSTLPGPSAELGQGGVDGLLAQRIRRRPGQPTDVVGGEQVLGRQLVLGRQRR